VSQIFISFLDSSLELHNKVIILEIAFKIWRKVGAVVSDGPGRVDIEDLILAVFRQLDTRFLQLDGQGHTVNLFCETHTILFSDEAAEVVVSQLILTHYSHLRDLSSGLPEGELVEAIRIEN